MRKDQIFMTLCLCVAFNSYGQSLSIGERAKKISESYERCNYWGEDSLEQCQEIFFEYFPKDFTTFYELYENTSSLLYWESNKHLTLLSKFPKDTLLYRRLILVSINGRIYDESVNRLRAMARQSFLKDMKKFSGVLNDFDFESIVSVFKYLEENVDKMHQIEVGQLKEIKELYPKVYEAFVYSKR